MGESTSGSLATAAIVVTCNGRPLFDANLGTLLEQTKAFARILVVDNASEDATLEAIEHMRATHDPEGKIRILSYPHRISRYGPEHATTPGDSVHNFAYYNNWIISQASFQYVLKWDADMVLVRAVRDEFRRFLKRIQHGRWSAWTIKGQTIYRDLDGRFHLAKGEVNREVEVFPTSYCCRFKKHENWEGMTRSPWIRTNHFEPLCFYEVKFTNEDEFSHWSTTDFPGARKAREWENFHLIREGHVEPDRFEPLSSTFLDDQLSD